MADVQYKNIIFQSHLLCVVPISEEFRRFHHHYKLYRKTSNISRTLVGNKIVDNSDVVGASPVGAAPTTSSFST